MQFKLANLFLILIFVSIVETSFADDVGTSLNTNQTLDVAESTNATEQAEVVVSEEFEGLHKEKLKDVKEATVESTTDTAESSDFFWDIHWDKGLRYQLSSENPFWSVLFLGSKKTETKLDGKIGLRLDLDGMIYDESYDVPSADEGFYARRLRLYTAGYFFFFFPAFYKVETEVSDGNLYLRESFLWLDQVPYLQTVKIGHFKAPSTFDNMISSRDRSFMESASPVEAFAQGLKVGIQLSDSLAEENITWAAGWFVNGNETDLSDASDSLSRLIWRVTHLLVDDRDTHSLIHLGYSGSLVYTGDKDVQYRSRPESYVAPRLVDTGKIKAKDANIHAAEFAMTEGPFSFQSEFVHSLVYAEKEHLEFYGAYGTFGWCITGENRRYLRDRGVFGQILPRNDFSLESGGLGAWEFVMRYSYLDLRDKSVDGGRMSTGAVGLNWHLNRTVTMRMNAIYSDVEGGENPGHVIIGQSRLSIDF